jgi:hypothetical protein
MLRTAEKNPNLLAVEMGMVSPFVFAPPAQSTFFAHGRIDLRIDTK